MDITKRSREMKVVSTHRRIFHKVQCACAECEREIQEQSALPLVPVHRYLA